MAARLRVRILHLLLLHLLLLEQTLLHETPHRILPPILVLVGKALTSAHTLGLVEAALAPGVEGCIADRMLVQRGAIRPRLPGVFLRSAWEEHAARLWHQMLRLRLVWHALEEGTVGDLAASDERRVLIHTGPLVREGHACDG